MEKNDDIFSECSLKICQVDEKSNVSENVFINNEKYFNQNVQHHKKIMVQPAYIILAFNNKEYYTKSGFNLFEVRDIIL